MGHLHLSLAAWSIPADLSPDWGAANQTIESISVEDLTDGGEERRGSSLLGRLPHGLMPRLAARGFRLLA
jgi:hypothetical protein